MLGDLFDTVTATVRGWWLALAEAPWSALGAAVLLALLLAGVGYLAGWLVGRRRKASVSAPLRAVPAGAGAEVEALTRRLREAEAARDAALAVRGRTETEQGDARRRAEEAAAARAAAEQAAADAAAALKAAEADRGTALRRGEEAETRTRNAEEELRDALARLHDAEARAAALEAARAADTQAAEARLATALAEAEAQAAQRLAAAGAEAERRAAEAVAAAEARVAAAEAELDGAAARFRQEADARVAEASAAADARAARVTAELEARLAAAADAAQARTDSAMVEARAAREALGEAEAVIANLSGAALRSAALAFEHGEGSLAAALDEARQYVAHHGGGLATVLRLRALDALDGTPEGLARARDNAAVAKGLGAGLEPAEAEDVAILAETLEAARRSPALAADPAKAEAAGLPRLAEALWLKRAEAAQDPAALAKAAAAALWGGRWIEAAGLGAAAARALSEAGDAAGALAARLTAARAQVFAGVPDLLPALETLAADAASTLGRDSETAWEARRLHVRLLFEAGEAEAAEQATAGLAGGPVDPAADPVLRVARARGLMVAGEPDAAAAVFEALARQAGETTRAGLGHRLDATEARLADGVVPSSVLETLDRLAPAIREAFGPRHPRAGQAALLRAQALAEQGERAAAADALAEAEAVFAPRFDPAHRWRAAAGRLREQLPIEPPGEVVSLSGAVFDTAAEEAPAEPAPEWSPPSDPVPQEPGEPDAVPVEEPAPEAPVQRPGPWGAYGGGDPVRPVGS